MIYFTKALQLDHHGSAGCDFRSWDLFGSPMNFHIGGRLKYQTRLGAIFSFLYIGLLVVSFWYYLAKWTDKTSPAIVTNEYRTDTPAKADIIQENLFLEFIFTNKGVSMDFQTFNENFTLIVTNFIVNYDPKLSPIDQVKWIDIPIMSCDKADWVKKYAADTDYGTRRWENYVCLDTKSLTLYGGSTTANSRLTLTLYQCQAGGKYTCKNTIQPQNLVFNPNVWQ